MRILAIPPRLRAWALALFLASPLVALQTFWASRAPWWKVPWTTLSISACVALALAIPLAWGLSRLKSWAAPVALVAASAWISGSIFWSLRYADTRMALFTVLITAFVVVIGLAIRREGARSYLDPNLRWYQGAPVTIPGLECRLTLGDRTEEFRVVRLDDDGVFLFAPHRRARGALPRLRRKDRPELRLSYRERQVWVPAQPVAATQDGSGLGLRFRFEANDRYKNLGDFIEILRGEGHA